MFQKIIHAIWPKHIWLIAFLVISPAVYLIPNDVFTQYPWTKAYTDWLAQWIPMIDRAAHLHPHPDKFRAFFAYAWSWVPVLLVLAWWVGAEKMKAHAKKMLARQTFTALSLIALSLWILWLAIYVPRHAFGGVGLIDRYDMRVRLYYSDWALLWSGPVQVWSVVGFVLLLLCLANAIRAEIYAIKIPGQEN